MCFEFCQFAFYPLTTLSFNIFHGNMIFFDQFRANLWCEDLLEIFFFLFKFRLKVLTINVIVTNLLHLYDSNLVICILEFGFDRIQKTWELMKWNNGSLCLINIFFSITQSQPVVLTSKVLNPFFVCFKGELF